jgi:hypothetical protein
MELPLLFARFELKHCRVWARLPVVNVRVGDDPSRTPKTAPIQDWKRALARSQQLTDRAAVRKPARSRLILPYLDLQGPEPQPPERCQPCRPLLRSGRRFVAQRLCSKGQNIAGMANYCRWPPTVQLVSKSPVTDLNSAAGALHSGLPHRASAIASSVISQVRGFCPGP